MVDYRISAIPEITVLAEFDDITIISDEPTPLFDIRQTAAYIPTPRTQAYWEFEDIFLRYSRRDSWIHKTDLRTGEELDDWITETDYPFSSQAHLRNFLTDDLVRKHINQKQIVGVKGTALTRFAIIDLDFHGRNLEVFLKQAGVLLDQFHGTGTWHYQIKREDVSGLQLIHVFPEPRELAAVHQELRKILAELDSQNPQLAAEAKAAGMKSLSDLELYPTNGGNGVRLPLCRDRVVLLDRELSLVTHRKQRVQDVEGYINWLNDPHRKYIAKEHILDHLRNIATCCVKTSMPKTTAPKPHTHSQQSAWKGNLRRWLYEFWIEGDANGRPLNEHIAVLARLAHVYGYSETEICVGLSELVRGLPACASSCSSRLLKGQMRKIDSVIANTAKYVCDNNGHQRDAKNSSEILAGSLIQWPGFDPLDLSTWSKPVEKPVINPNWSEEQRSRLCAFFRKPLFVKDDELIIRFINGIVKLTIAKEKEGNGWGKEFLLKWMQSQFPQIKCAKDEKRQRIMHCLKEEGIIAPIARGRSGMYATHWTLGTVAKQALAIKDSESLSTIPQEVPTGKNNTSIYYSSLFQDVADHGCQYQELSVAMIQNKSINNGMNLEQEQDTSLLNGGSVQHSNDGS
ncbi:hypothetical protein [Planctomicrobium sp. SH527]|uniref:hypothetical protein n=1 Tax=Planctomicrobium sp. SH527 TaxID=3448123 RepID=UPI003F5BF7D3